MKTLYTLILVFLIWGISFSQEQNLEKNREPKATFLLQINDKEYTLSEGEELKLDITIIQPVISIKLADLKKLDSGSISFNYPNNFSFEFEEDQGYKNWNLDANDFVIMYFEIDAELGLEEFVNSMVLQFGKKNCTVGEARIKLGKRTLVGKRINVSLVGQRLTIDLLKIELNDSKSRYIAFQDVKNEDGTSSTERKETMKIIAESMKYE